MDKDRDKPWNFHICKLCPYRTRSMFVMNIHLRLHERRLKTDFFICDSKSPEGFQCELCEFQTNLKVDLTEHLRVFHGGKAANEEFENIFKCLHCENCDFETHSVLFLAKHVDNCNNSSTRRKRTKNLTTKSLEGVKWLKCKHCPHKTPRRSYLEAHILSKHTNPEDIVWLECAQCGHKTKTEGTLKRHIHIKHKNPEVWFTCGQCEHKSKTESDLKNHVMTHSNARDGTCINSVLNLLTKPFNSLPSAVRIEIKRLGRPTPNLNIKQSVSSKNRTFNRTFNNEIYKKHTWICGCDVKNALFCFPCLLFGGEHLWAKVGMSDLNHLADRIKKHASSEIHLKNVIQLSFFGNVDIATQLDSAYRRNVQTQNEKVRQNRYILNIIINCVRFCGAFELAMRGQESSNPGVFGGLINFSAALDSALKEHLEKAEVFKGMSRTIQNEILQTMFEVCQEEISKEIQEADYLSVIVDETSDVSNSFQMAIIFRYITNGKLVERFWDFLNPTGHDVETLTSCILIELEKHVKNNKKKLIAQTYDGATVMNGSSCGVQALVKQTYEHAAYVHCYAHQLNLVMLNAASANTNVRIFFSNLQGLCAFFANSPQRTAILDEIVTNRLPNPPPTKWNFNSRSSKSVGTIFEHREDIIQSIRRILTESKNADAIHQASGHIKIITSKSFVFWLNFFYKIMPQVDLLSSKFQSKQIDPMAAKMYVALFATQILNIRNSVDQLLLLDVEPSTAKQRKIENKTFIREAKQVCDIIISQAKDRFSFTGHLIAATLFCSDKFGQYNSAFPEKNFKETVTVYPFFDDKKLRTELSVIYGAEDFRSVSGLVVLYDYISENSELSESFSETLKLLKVLITIPMNSAEAERCFWTLERIRTFLRNTVSEERLSALAMLSKERDLVESMPTFNQRVMDKFAAAEGRRADFLFK